MKFERFSLPIRIVMAVVIGYAMLRFLFAGSSGHLDPAAQLIGLFLAVVYGLILFALFGFSMIRRFAERFGALYEPGDEHFRIRPEYSTAEARVKVGRYEQAIEEFRKVIALHPGDIYAHLRIAQLAVEQLNDPGLAEMELTSAVAKASTEDSIVMAHHRLADFYEHTRHDGARAIAVMRQLQARLPATKHRLGAQQRIDSLGRASSGPPPAAPSKIAMRPSRYKIPE
jgi:hypothetical protein